MSSSDDPACAVVSFSCLSSFICCSVLPPAVTTSSDAAAAVRFVGDGVAAATSEGGSTVPPFAAASSVVPASTVLPVTEFGGSGSVALSAVAAAVVASLPASLLPGASLLSVAVSATSVLADGCFVASVASDAASGVAACSFFFRALRRPCGHFQADACLGLRACFRRRNNKNTRPKGQARRALSWDARLLSRTIHGTSKNRQFSRLHAPGHMARFRPPDHRAAERCRSGRTGRSRKPLWAQVHPGFESLSLRHLPFAAGGCPWQKSRSLCLS